MVVDDAVVVRGLIARWIEAEAGPAGRRPRCAAAARRSSSSSAPTPTSSMLDVDMPDIDGITALPRLLEKKRDLVVIMASTLTRRNAEISLRALSLGAADYIPKPRDHPRDHHLGRVPPRADRQDPGARRAPRAARPMLRAAPPSVRRPCDRARPRPGRAARQCCARARPEQPGLKLRPFPPTAAARAADRFLDRRTAGAEQRCSAGSTRVIDQAPGADDPAHAADLHDHPRRASVARQRPPCARGGARRAGARRPDLYRAGRPAHAGGAPRRRAAIVLDDGAAGQFLQARGRPAVLVRRRGLGRARARASCSPAWAPTARAAPPTSWRPAAA